MIGGIFMSLGSVIILRLSWSSLSNPQSHGYPRFFAFEAILGLLVLNTPYWFTEPLVPRQILSWVLLLASLYLVISGYYLLRTAGHAVGGDWEHTTNLIQHGIFRYIRHPLYASLFYLAWGAALKHPERISLMLASMATVFLIFTMQNEEAENLDRFGKPYENYMGETKRLVPGIF
ncbi:MAG: isoprenylcysteine carboxyl methyltransferase [Candidatus Marinimicrobia bacterium CG_4_10_14_0_2_um_filter_48_9]|nr:MAG: isoprenylcysteine carboxyl methyltransferase [Candidatus Marinimicrobia bacterium CG_4_10_14_0_2_um_filter_48_9]PJA52735.1 MAG: isoprenylcysteine carboxyl methyltransferase [Candidatus Marinimicrobia bacterium CG_4_9_14_3_um_filter_48_9]